MVSEDYSLTLEADGTEPITWSIIKGSLPKGLSMDDTGEIYGTPEYKGTCTFTVLASNDAGTDKKEYRLTIDAPVKPTIKTESLPSGKEGSSYSQTVVAIGTEPITWSIINGSMPDTFSLDKETGKISGTLSKAGTYTFTVEAKNIAGTDSKDYTIEIEATPHKIPPTITTEFLQSGTINHYYSEDIEAEGTKPISFSTSQDALPPGLSINGAGRIHGTPTALGTYNFTVWAKNTAGADSRDFEITIDPPLPPIIITKSCDAVWNENRDFQLRALGAKPMRWRIEWLMHVWPDPDAGKLSVYDEIKLSDPVAGILEIGAGSKKKNPKFKVLVSNDYGSDEAIFTVTRIAKPEIKTK